MDGFQLTVIAKAFTDRQWADDASRARRQAVTVADLDERADLGLHWPDLTGFFSVCVNAARVFWSLGTSSRLHPKPLSRVETPLPGR